MAWSLSSVLVAGHGVLPSANLGRLTVGDDTGEGGARSRGSGPMDTGKLIGFLKANRQGERYLLATSSTRLAAPIIIETGEAVMAMGGFHGLDPILTPETLARMVEGKQVRFVMLNDLSIVSRRMGGEAAGRPIADWVQKKGKLVDPALWRARGADGSPRRGSGARTSGMQLYDLRPGPGARQSG
jgi:hypothetical protein